MRKLKTLLLLAGWLLLSPSPGNSQATLTETTVSSAVSLTDTTVNVTSATGVVVGDIAFIEREGMRVTAISGTALTVIRGVLGTVTAHPSLTEIYLEPPEFFISVDRFGTCTSAAVYPLILPVINTTNGNIYDCINSVWTLVNSDQGQKLNLISGSGATRTLITGQSGSLILLDRAAGITITLPAPAVGLTYTFLATVSVTSNAYKFSTATQGTDFILGGDFSIDTDTADAVAFFRCNGTTHDNYSMNGTTTGGLIGSWFRLTALTTTQWLLEALNQGSGIVATACSTT